MSRHRVVAAGLAVVAAYTALAGLSGRLSPLARGPLLDGLGPPQPYRWVNPPPDLASTNQPPSAGVFHVPLDANASLPEVFVTSDNQATIVVPKGAFALRAGQIEVVLSVDPVDPGTLSPPGAGLTVFGNAYRLRAAYQPSGKQATLAVPLEVILLYPVTTNLHATTHQLASSTDGKTWTRQQGSDSIAQQQAEGPVTSLGFVVVVGKASPSPTSSPSSPSSGRAKTLAIALIVGAVCVGLIGLGLILRGRGSGED